MTYREQKGRGWKAFWSNSHLYVGLPGLLRNGFTSSLSSSNSDSLDCSWWKNTSDITLDEDTQSICMLLWCNCIMWLTSFCNLWISSSFSCKMAEWAKIVSLACLRSKWKLPVIRNRKCGEKKKLCEEKNKHLLKTQRRFIVNLCHLQCSNYLLQANLKQAHLSFH